MFKVGDKVKVRKSINPKHFHISGDLNHKDGYYVDGIHAFEKILTITETERNSGKQATYPSMVRTSANVITRRLQIRASIKNGHQTISMNRVLLTP